MKQMSRRIFSGAMVFLLILNSFAVFASASLPTSRIYTTVAGGMAHTLALKQDGTVWGWGSNAQYQLGLSDTANYEKPTQVEGMTSIVAVAAGYDSSAAVSANGAVYYWGGAAVKTPQQVAGLSGIVMVACGQTEFLALKSDGTVWKWQLGVAPSRVSGLSAIAKISVGSQHFLALSNCGEVYAWGGNWNGQLGLGDNQNHNVPTKISDLSNISDISAGYSHSLAIGHDGTLYAWGSNTYGQLGTGDTQSHNTPFKVTKLTNVTLISAGYESSMAKTKTIAYAWGYGEYGQLGNGTQTVTALAPLSLSVGSSSVSYLASGMYHNMALNEKGELYLWGRNKDGQLGTGKTTNENTAKRVLTAVRLGDAYESGQLSTASSWAVEELEGLYGRNLLIPELWQNYTVPMTRGELARLLVIVYEAVKNTTVSYSDNTTFKDLSNHTLRVYMLKANKLGIMEGYSSTVAAPDNTITRQEAAKMLSAFTVKVKGGTIPTTTQSLSYYDDAAKISDWAIPYVAYAYQNSIMKGTGSSFQPTDLMSTEQAYLMVARLAAKYNWSA